MRQQPITEESWTDAEAMRRMHDLSCRGGATGSVRQGSKPAGQAASRRAILARAIETEVIPRLLAAPRAPGVTAPPRQPRPDEVASLVALALAGNPAETCNYVTRLARDGVSTEAVLLDLLAPAARELGRLWEEDTADFTDVTVGLLQLNKVMALLDRAFGGGTGTSVLLAQVPGEQHGFGLAMVAHFFRNEGWRVRQACAPTSDGLVQIVAEDWFDLIGLSMSCSDRLEQLAADIRAIRRHARNPQIGVLVGGPPFVAHPQLAAMVGADATAADARQAVGRARAMISAQAARR
jgi:methanogenic corrinoid protein MtbC1